MPTYEELRDSIVKEAEEKFGFPFDNRPRIKLCHVSGPCVDLFEERVKTWFENKAFAFTVCQKKGHEFKPVNKCQRCGLTSGA